MWKNYPSKANNSNSINSNNRVIILYDFKFKYNLQKYLRLEHSLENLKVIASLSKTKTLVNDERALYEYSKINGNQKMNTSRN
jgi:hypothetical protein